MQATDLSSSMESLTYETSSLSSPTNSSTMGPGGGMSQQQQQQARTKRMRTSFKHHQLRTMKSYFNINQNPDAKDLKQLAQKTGLSKRVLQVRKFYLLMYKPTRPDWIQCVPPTYTFIRLLLYCTYRFGSKTLGQNGDGISCDRRTAKWWRAQFRTRIKLHRPIQTWSEDTRRLRRLLISSICFDLQQFDVRKQ